MKQVFLAITSGVYRHEVLGIFTTEAKARVAAEVFFEAEKDHYHEVEILPLKINEFLELRSIGSSVYSQEPVSTMLSPSSRG